VINVQQDETDVHERESCKRPVVVNDGDNMRLACKQRGDEQIGKSMGDDRKVAPTSSCVASPKVPLSFEFLGIR
jgi:hypothetical protein